MEKVNLWTRQDEKILDILETEGIFQAKKRFVMEKYGDLFPLFDGIYSWLIFESDKIVKKPEGSEYPIWCSVSDEMMLRETKGTVILKLSVDKEKVVFFDSLRWDYAINNMYVPENQADYLRFKEKLKSRGLDPDYPVLDDNISRFYPDIKRDILMSRVKIFDIKDSPIERLQANIWEIRPEEISEIKYFRE